VRSVLTIAIFVTAVSALAAEMPRRVPNREPDIEVSSPSPMVIFRPVLRDSEKIFSGTVLQVEHRNSDSSSALATTRILFRVEEAIRSVKRGQVVEVNEWGGLWQSGERYQRGERVLLFLYPPSKLGLTSPVGNRAGRFSVDRAGRVLLKSPSGRPPQQIGIRRVIAAIRQAEKE
jgi:hypothetical protein